MAKPKTKKCKNPQCGEEFIPRNSLQKTCWKVECALAVGRQERETQKKRALKEYRAETRKRKEKIKSLSDWLKEAQIVFNRYIRHRDAALPCISCGRHHQGQYHAGHYRTTKAAPHLRFDERQTHKQCQPCNEHLSGNIGEYRIGLIKKIGIDAVEAIENDNRIHRYTMDEAKAIKAKYTKKIKEIEGR